MLRRRPIARLAVGTAVVAGTAGAVNNHMQNKQAAQQAAQEPQYAAPEPAGPSSDSIQRLTELAELKEKGILTDAEFEVQKAKILAG